MHRKKGPKIALGYVHDPTKSVDHKITGRDPSADRAGGDVELLRHVGDGEEFDWLALTAASRRVMPVPAHRLSSYSEVDWTGLLILASA